ncbi:MAG TPA: ATP-binding protein [Alphaproteobacteria bacterium]|nr:ATP-binding protein [Alphaproteobacteria bacterium]
MTEAPAPARPLPEGRAKDRGALRPLTLLLAASLLVPALLFIAAALEDRAEVLRNAESRVESVAGLLREHAQKVFETHDLVLRQLDSRIAGLGWDEIESSILLHTELADVSNRLEQVDVVSLVDGAGRLRNSSRGFPANRVDLSDREYFQAQRGGATGTVVSEPYIGRNTSKPQFNISRRRTTPDGSFDGILLASVTPEYFQRFYSNIAPGLNYSAGLVRADGIFLVRDAAAPPVASGQPRASAFFMAAIKADPRGGSFHSVSAVDGQRRIVGYQRLEGWPVYVLFALGHDAVLEEWRQNLMVYGSVAAIASLALFLATLTAWQRARQERQALLRWRATAFNLEREIEKREETEAALRQSEENYRTLYMQTPVMLHSIDRTGRIVQVSDYWLDKMGYGPDEVLGRPITDFLTEPSARFVEEVGLPMLMREGRTSQLSYEMVRRDGSVMNVLLNAVAQTDSAGAFIRSLSVSTDVTDWLRTAEQLRQSQKMEAVGQLTGGVAHDFNNLLTVIAGNLRLAGKAKDDERRQRALEAAGAAAQRAEGLTRALLAFSRRQTLTPQAIDLAARLRGMEPLLRGSLREDIALDFDLPAGLWTVEADGGQLELAVVNIAVNARDAMAAGAGGSLRIAAENAELAEPGGLTGAFVRLRLSDTGPGMPPEVRARVFEPFFTTKEPGRGTGLGLAMVYGFARQSGGDARIESGPGGTTVELLLPRARAAAAPPPAEPAAPAASGRSGTILVVEDSAEVGDLAAAVLGDAGYTIHRASSGQAALDLLAGGLAVDLVFSDIVMPGGLSGLDLARRLAAARPELPVLLTTGYSQAASEGDAPAPILPKPYSPDALLRAIADALPQRVAAAGWSADFF